MAEVRGKTVECKCKCCHKPFMARVADRKRGWARFCSKSCKAIKQEQRTGQIGAYIANGGEPGRKMTPDLIRQRQEIRDHESAMDAAYCGVF